MINERVKAVVFGAVFLAGLIILLNSMSLGENTVSRILQARGGMDGNQYLIYLDQSIANYRAIGTILSALGGFGLLTALKARP